MTAPHTPTPWEQHWDDYCCVVCGSETICETRNSDQAGEIVRCVNSHAALVEACERLVSDFELECECVGRAPDDMTEPPPCGLCVAREALRLAKGAQA